MLADDLRCNSGAKHNSENERSTKGSIDIDTGGTSLKITIDEAALAQVDIKEIGKVYSYSDSLVNPNGDYSGGLTGGFTDTSGCIDDPNSEDPNAEGGQRCSSQDSSSSLAGTGKKIGIGIAVLAGLYLVKTIAGLPSLKKTFTLGSGRIRIRGREFNFDGPGKWAYIGRVLQGIGTTISNILLKLWPLPTAWQFAARNGVNKLNETINADFNTDSKGAFLDLAVLDPGADIKAVSIGCSGGLCSEVELKCDSCTKKIGESDLINKKPGLKVEADGTVTLKRTQFIETFKADLVEGGDATKVLAGMIGKRESFINDTFVEKNLIAGSSFTDAEQKKFLGDFNAKAKAKAGDKWDKMTSGERKDFMDRNRGAILKSMTNGETNFQKLNADGKARFTQAVMFNNSLTDLGYLSELGAANSAEKAGIVRLNEIKDTETKIKELSISIEIKTEEADRLSDDEKAKKTAEIEGFKKQKEDLVAKNDAAIEGRTKMIEAEIDELADGEAKTSLEAEKAALDKAKTGDTDGLEEIIKTKTESLKSGGGDLDARLRQAGVFSSDFVAPKVFGSTLNTSLRAGPGASFKNIKSAKGVGALGALGAGLGILFAGLSGGDAEVFQAALVRGTPKIERLLAELKALEVEWVELRLAYLNQKIE